MKHILHLKSSLQGAASYSIKLGNAIVEKIQEKYPGNILEEVDLVQPKFRILTLLYCAHFSLPAMS